MFGNVLPRCSATRIFQGAVLSVWSSAGSFCSRLLLVGHSGLAVVFSGEHMFGGGIIHSSDWLEFFYFRCWTILNFSRVWFSSILSLL